MKRKTRGGHHAKPPQASTITAMLIISFSIAALLIGLILLICASHKLAGGANANPRPVVSSFPLGGDRNDTNSARGVETATQAVTTHILHDEPLEGGDSSTVKPVITSRGDGKSNTIKTDATAPQQRSIWTTNATAYVHAIVAQQEAARVRQAKIDAITSYIVQYHGAPGLIALAPLIVDTATATGMDCRMAPCTAAAESTCGAGSSNLFGYLGGNSNSWDAQIIGYYNRIAELNNQHGWNNNWMIAWYWYGGGSETGADGTGTSAGYADNVIRDVESIGW